MLLQKKNVLIVNALYTSLNWSHEDKFQHCSFSCPSEALHSGAPQQVSTAWEPPGFLATRPELLDDKVDRMVAIYYSFIIDVMLVISFQVFLSVQAGGIHHCARGGGQTVLFSSQQGQTEPTDLRSNTVLIKVTSYLSVHAMIKDLLVSRREKGGKLLKLGLKIYWILFS